MDARCCGTRTSAVAAVRRDWPHAQIVPASGRTGIEVVRWQPPGDEAPTTSNATVAQVLLLPRTKPRASR
jgi:hypothetical protein